jgi:hypothetical protein
MWAPHIKVFYAPSSSGHPHRTAQVTQSTIVQKQKFGNQLDSCSLSPKVRGNAAPGSISLLAGRVTWGRGDATVQGKTCGARP